MKKYYVLMVFTVLVNCHFLIAADENDKTAEAVSDSKQACKVCQPPIAEAENYVFSGIGHVKFEQAEKNGQFLRYTLDGSIPSRQSPVCHGTVHVADDIVITAAWFNDQRRISEVSRVSCRQSCRKEPGKLDSGLYGIYQAGNWQKVPALKSMDSIQPKKVANIDLSVAESEDFFAVYFVGWIRIERAGVYRFSTESDDGSILRISGLDVVSNDGLHPSQTKSGSVYLCGGLHPFSLGYFEATGRNSLSVRIEGPGMKSQPLPDNMLFRASNYAMPDESGSAKKCPGNVKPVAAVNIDYSQCPQAAEWARKVQKLAEENYPMIADCLRQPGYLPKRQVMFYFKPKLKAPAYASGGSVCFNGDYILKHPGDVGCVIHELTHVVQRYPNYQPWWLCEGIADYVRFFKFEPISHRPRPHPDRVRLQNGYRDVAAFLFWLENNYDKEIVRKLNAEFRSNRYSDDLFRKFTAKSLDDLWKEFVDSLRNKG